MGLFVTLATCKGEPRVKGTVPFTHAIEGLPHDAAVQLLWDVKEHCIQPRFRYHHRYEVGDLVIFDTFSTLHAATRIGIAGSAWDDDARLNGRISVRGLPAVHRHMRRSNAQELPVRGRRRAAHPGAAVVQAQSLGLWKRIGFKKAKLAGARKLALRAAYTKGP